MKKFRKLALVIVLVFVFSIVVCAEENYDFILSDVAYDEENVGEIAEIHSEFAEELKSSLDRCKTLSYETKIEETLNKLDTITAETARERDAIISEKEEEGFTTTVEAKQHEAAVLNYEFNVLNDRVTSATRNGNDYTTYNGKSESDVVNSSEFEDYEDDDVIITNEITTDINEDSGSETFSRGMEAVARRNVLRNQGYTADVTQNNTQAVVFALRSARTLDGFQLNVIARQQVESENPGKEIVYLFAMPMPTEVVDTFKADSLDAANTKAEELRASGDYASVTVNVTRDHDHPTLVSEGNEGGWDENQTGTEYDEDIYTDEVVTGYSHHYKESSTQTVTVTEDVPGVRAHNRRSSCEDEIRPGRFPEYTNLQCVRVTVTSPYGIPYDQYVLRGDITREVTVETPYYDVYAYPEVFNVLANYYTYNVTYLATDYTVTYNGTKGTITIRKSSADKYYDIDAEKTEYNVTTTGTILEDAACLNPKTINTGASESAIYEILSVLTLFGLVFILDKKTRKEN